MLYLQLCKSFLSKKNVKIVEGGKTYTVIYRAHNIYLYGGLTLFDAFTFTYNNKIHREKGPAIFGPKFRYKLYYYNNFLIDANSISDFKSKSKSLILGDESNIIDEYHDMNAFFNSLHSI